MPSPSAHVPQPTPTDRAHRDLAAVVRLTAELQPALRRRDYAALREVIGRLVAARAPLGEQWPTLAQIAADIAELELSRRALELYVELEGGTDLARYKQAAGLAQAGDWDDAETLLAALPDDAPTPLAHAYTGGVIALNRGRLDDARQRLERVLAERPDTGPAWLCLAMATDFADDPALAERLIAAERRVDEAPPAERGGMLYAVGKAHADRGEHALAFAAFARGAAQMKAVAGYDHAADRAGAEEAVRGHSVAGIAQLARRSAEPTGRTIFATGLPRSGTTLLEQVLTAHSAVAGGAEIGALKVLAGAAGGVSHAALARFVETGGGPAATELWHRWLGERFAAPGRVVDKSVDASRYLGLVAALLPDAPLIWSTRDPLDRAWSCFRTNFQGGAMPWSYDLADIAAHFRLEDRLLAQWRDILGERLLVVPYEALVAEPEAWIRRILAHCGLDEEAQVFAPHENRRAVTTASMVQVRRPIGAGAVGSAEPYREFLAPFIEAYYR